MNRPPMTIVIEKQYGPTKLDDLVTGTYYWKVFNPPVWVMGRPSGISHTVKGAKRQAQRYVARVMAQNAIDGPVFVQEVALS